MAAPEGNNNSSKDNRLWANTIRRAIVQGDGQKLRAIAEKLIELAASGDIQAIKEIGDRLDGKSQQRVDVEHGGVVTHEHFGLPDLVGRADELLERHRPSAPSLPN